MRHIKNDNIKGLTLVEVVVSIAIFGIISVGLLSMLVEGLLITSRAGDRSESVMHVASEIEKKLADPSYTINAVLSEGSPQATIYYNHGTINESTHNMDGKLITGNELNERGQEIEVTVFVPEAISP